MEKVMITGLGIGHKMGLCDACNLDFSWLFYNASTMLWADKICLPKDLYDLVINRHHNKQEIAISIMLQILKEHNLIEMINDIEFELQPEALVNIQRNIIIDVKEIEKRYPETVKLRDIEGNSYDNIIIENNSYCLPYIASIYASIFIAEAINAHCLFDDHTYTFLKYKTRLDSQRGEPTNIPNIYNDLFSFVLPNEIIPPQYAITDEERCENCDRVKICSIDYEKEIKKYINKVLSIRNYDELFQLRNEIEQIVRFLILNGEDITSNAIREELQVRQQKINSLIHRRFEQVKRWSKIASICSVPATIISVANANFPATIISASLLGLSKAANEVMDYYKSKKKWVGFLHVDD